jgi:2-oxoglutarate ferredoxin oxidoreductase subunit alpha
MQPVIVLTDETIGHMHGKAMIPTVEEVKKRYSSKKNF